VPPALELSVLEPPVRELPVREPQPALQERAPLEVRSVPARLRLARAVRRA